jgi:thiazole/oxazole-forming peptide maturase SagD family component
MLNKDFLMARDQSTLLTWPKLMLEFFTDYPTDLIGLHEPPLPKIDSWDKYQRLIKQGIAALPKLSPFFNDEPKLYGYSSVPSVNPFTNKSEQTTNKGEYGHGFDFTAKGAFIRSLGECIERECIRLFPTKGFKKGTYSNLSKKFNLMNLNELIVCDNLPKKTDLSNVNFSWMEVYDLLKKQEVFVPTQLVYVPSTLEPFKNELILRLPITTGAAFGIKEDYSDSILRGIYECIERDGNMISYCTQREIPKIKVDNLEIKEILDYFYSYGLMIDLFLTSTDLQIPSVMAIIRNKDNHLPHLSVGSCCNLDPKRAVLGAIREAQQVRNLLRFSYFGHTKPIPLKKQKVLDVETRVLFWSDRSKEKHLSFLLNSKKSINLSKIPNLDLKDDKKNINLILNRLKELNMEIYMADISLPEVKKEGFRVIKIIIPQLHPLWLNENFPCKTGRRLAKYGGYKAKEIHPFP